MNIETDSRRAFENVADAVEKIERYRETKEIGMLVEAESALSDALRCDRDYLGAIFYSGVVQDLIGKPADAVPYFERVLQSAHDQAVREEAEYNLGVAHYHRYSHPYLARAEKHFLRVIETTANQILASLARANMAQTYAMWMRPSREEKRALNDVVGDPEQYAHHPVIQKIEERFGQHLACVEALEPALNKNCPRGSCEDDDWKKIKATSDNAQGMALMYSVDHLPLDNAEKQRRLAKSLRNLESADALFPKDWANTSDLGSNYLRQGLHLPEGAKRDEKFATSVAYLKKVVDELRPNYGFSLFELGNVYKSWGKFDKAICYYDRSLAVDDRYRDISRPAVESQRAAALAHDTSYPL